MASILRIKPHEFMEVPHRADSFERVRWISCAAVADMAHHHGIEHITIDDAYSHMRRLRFKWPATYGMCDEAANRITVEDSPPAPPAPPRTITATRDGTYRWTINGIRCIGIAEARCATMNAMDAAGYETGMADMGPIDDGLEAMEVGETAITPIPEDEDD